MWQTFDFRIALTSVRPHFETRFKKKWRLIKCSHESFYINNISEHQLCQKSHNCNELFVSFQKCLPNEWLLSCFQEVESLFISPVLLVISSHFGFMFFESVFSEKSLRWSVNCVLTDGWTHSKLSAPLLLCSFALCRMPGQHSTVLRRHFPFCSSSTDSAALSESRWIQMVFHRTNCGITHLVKGKISVNQGRVEKHACTL